MPSAPTIYQQYRLAVAVAFSLALSAATTLAWLGKTDSFLLINSWNTAWLDRVMPYVTYLGDGNIYIPILLLTWFFRRDYIVAVAAGIIICFVFTHGLKQLVFPHELRPYVLEEQKIRFHRVDWVPLNRNYSFPSGHTSTAFTMALLLAALMRQRAWVILLPFVALLVGFSRIYLAQHFLTDVTAGIFIGIASSYLALLVYRTFHKRRIKVL